MDTVCTFIFHIHLTHVDDRRRRPSPASSLIPATEDATRSRLLSVYIFTQRTPRRKPLALVTGLPYGAAGAEPAYSPDFRPYRASRWSDRSSKMGLFIFICKVLYTKFPRCSGDTLAPRGLMNLKRFKIQNGWTRGYNSLAKNNAYHQFLLYPCQTRRHRSHSYLQWFLEHVRTERLIYPSYLHCD